MSAWRRLIAFRDDAPKPSLYEQGLEAGLTLWAWGLLIAALFGKIPYEVAMAYVGLLLLGLPIRRRVTQHVRRRAARKAAGNSPSECAIAVGDR